MKQTTTKHILPSSHINEASCLVLLSVLVLLLTNLKRLASLQGSLGSGLALLALETEHQLLSLLRLQLIPLIHKIPSCGR